MSATNSTANYELPIFLATDKPAWLTDWNGAMSAIDTAIHSAQATADGAQTSAGTAIADIATINASLTTITGNITSLTTTVNGHTGAINTINSLIGNGQPTTEDKTLIGAINEIYAMITGGGDPVEAENVSYNNTTSGLTATDVQSAIDELASAPAPTPGYDLNLQDMGTLTLTPETGWTFIGDEPLRLLLNATKNIGKIYGGFLLQFSSLPTSGVWTKIATLSSPNLVGTAQSYNINYGTAPAWTSQTPNTNMFYERLVFNTDGTINIEVKPMANVTATNSYINIPPCLLFLKDLND